MPLTLPTRAMFDALLARAASARAGAPKGASYAETLPVDDEPTSNTMTLDLGSGPQTMTAPRRGTVGADLAQSAMLDERSGARNFDERSYSSNRLPNVMDDLIRGSSLAPQNRAMVPVGAGAPVTNLQSAHEVMPPPQIGAGSGFDMAMMTPIQRPDQLTQPLPSMPPVGSPERPQPQLRLEDILQMPQPDIMPLPEPTPWQTTGPHPGMAGLAGPGRMNPMSMPADYSPNYSPGSDPQFAQAPMQPFRMGGSGLDMAFQSRGMQRPNLPPIQPAPSTMGGIDMGSLSPRDLMPSLMSPTGSAFNAPSEPNPESMTMDFGGETQFLDRRRPALSPEQSAMEDEENAFRSLERTAPPEVVFEAASKRSGNAAKAAGGGISATEMFRQNQLTDRQNAALAARTELTQAQQAHQAAMLALSQGRMDATQAQAYGEALRKVAEMYQNNAKALADDPSMGAREERAKWVEKAAEAGENYVQWVGQMNAPRPPGGPAATVEATDEEINAAIDEIGEEVLRKMTPEEQDAALEKKIGKKIPQGK